MELELGLQGADATEQTLYSLQDWLKKEEITGLRVEIKSSPPKAEQMGVELITILSVVLASAAVVELVKSIHVWIQSTRPKVKVKIQVSESKAIEIDAENLPDSEALINKVLSILDES